MLHVTGGGSMKLHGLKKDHVHWTQVSGAASAATRAHPEEATAADAFPPKTVSTDGDGDLFLLVGSFFSFARARFSKNGNHHICAFILRGNHPLCVFILPSAAAAVAAIIL